MTEDIVERIKNEPFQWGDKWNLLEAAAEEIERLRSANLHLHEICQAQHDKIAAKGARIKELEAQLKEIEDDGDCLTAAYMLGGKRKADENKVLIDYIKRLEAAFLEARHDWACSQFSDRQTRDECDEHAREELERIRGRWK